MRIFLIFAFLVLIKLTASGLPDSLQITVSGIAYDSKNPSQRLPDLMIINMRTSQGTFGLADGSFRVNILRTDTMLVAVSGYEFKRVCFGDSAVKSHYNINVPIIKLNVTLKEVTIFSPRDLQSIYSDIEKLGYNKKDFQLSGVNAFSSPITFLYQEFSKYEQLRRRNAERINREKGKELLRQLLANYVAHDIINLDDREFDDFIEFCNVNESYMKSATQYDFCIYIKQRFEVYAMMKRR
jgi:hypothetical protein